MSARPGVAEERWLEVGARLRGLLASGALDARTGGWKTTGPIARIALFVAGALAALMLLGIVLLGSGGGGRIGLVVAGVLIVGAAEMLIREGKLFQSGFAEGAYLTGLLVLAFWLNEELSRSGVHGAGWLFGGLAFTIAGLRVANALLVALGAAALCGWIGMSSAGVAIDGVLGSGATATIVACGAAGAALLAGAREYARPSADRTFDAMAMLLPLPGALLDDRIALGAALSGDLHPAPSIVVTLVLVAYAALAGFTGVRRRRHAPLYGALFAGTAAIANARAVLGGPDEAWLVGVGLAALVVAVTLERLLREPRDGLTSSKLTTREGLVDLVQLAGAASLRAPSTPDAPAAPTDVTPGGGRYGGGGASGSF